jgi:hypothetical protein
MVDVNHSDSRLQGGCPAFEGIILYSFNTFFTIYKKKKVQYIKMSILPNFICISENWVAALSYT